jgi:hypothetical protein
MSHQEKQDSQYYQARPDCHSHNILKPFATFEIIINFKEIKANVTNISESSPQASTFASDF